MDRHDENAHIIYGATYGATLFAFGLLGESKVKMEQLPPAVLNEQTQCATVVSLSPEKEKRKTVRAATSSRSA